MEGSPYLSEDLLVEILARLPVQSLLRLSTVSKSWKTIIASPKFCSFHLSTNRNSSKILLTAQDRGQGGVAFGKRPEERHFLLNNYENLPADPSWLTPFDFPFEYPDWTSHHIVGSINGLICISQSLSYFPDAQPNLPIILWNPTVERHVCLPDPTFSLAYNASIEFGYAAATDDYKIVVVRQLGETIAPEFHVYSLNSNAWRGGFEMCPPAAAPVRNIEERGDRRIFGSTGAFAGGKMHWLVSNDYEMEPYCDTLYTFDVAEEVFAEVGLPPPPEEMTQLIRGTPRVAVVRDLLHVVQPTLITLQMYMYWTIWVKMEDAGSCDMYWKKLYRVDDVTAVFVCLLKNGELVMDKDPNFSRTVLHDVHGALVAYDPRDGKFKDLEPLSLSQQRAFGNVESRNHQETLVLLDRTLIDDPQTTWNTCQVQIEKDDN
ncbi:F-box and associated interaction domains-containing protein [Striga asiatica]|uniref:F-box and associated interaction domains-containing protein n=1 Tax=Striga asiatica TaxID=4170 RepID=A0A5A7QWV5_STRAF|nr:F-box and associated interaction domains-containing protein [Striga asiatica]